MKTIKLPNITVELLNEGIMHIHLNANSEITLNDAVHIVEAIGKITEGEKLPVLIDAGEFCVIDKEVRLFCASEGGSLYSSAEAIAYSNIAQKLMSNFYLNFNKPSVPTKNFADKKEAIQWLKTFIN